MRRHENECGEKCGEEGNEEEEIIDNGADGVIVPRLEAPGHRRAIYDQSPREARFWRGRHIKGVDGRGVGGKSVEHTTAICVAVEIVVIGVGR